MFDEASVTAIVLSVALGVICLNYSSKLRDSFEKLSGGKSFVLCFCLFIVVKQLVILL